VNRPSAEDVIYVAAVLTLYADLPDTPLRPTPMDQSVARKLYQEVVPLSLVESALLLATLRRRTRSSELPPLPKVRSLAYFLPVIAELQQQPLPRRVPRLLATQASATGPSGLMFRNLRFPMIANTLPLPLEMLGSRPDKRLLTSTL